MEFQLESGKYDCAVLGTGLSESVCASALALDGKSVLHIDKNEFYGGAASSANLETARKRCLASRTHSTGCPSSLPNMMDVHRELLSIGVDVELSELDVIPLSPVDPIKVISMSELGNSSCEVVKSSFNSKQFHPATFDYAMERLQNALPVSAAENAHPSFFGYRMDKTMTIRRAFHHSRQFSIDENPRILFAYGEMVDAMLTSGVNSYIEFVSIEGIFITRHNKASGKVEISAVPCSKADVFKSKLLSGLEKRALMKLLQLSIDYGNHLKGVDASYQNESTLVQGRALHRPQNRQDAAGMSFGADMNNEALKNKSFLTFLGENNIPPHLQDIVMFAMCLSRTCDCSAQKGLDFLYRHIYASGRLGETAFLYPIYGTSEIPESFCRSAAVHGAVYALRQGVQGLVRINSSTPKKQCPVLSTNAHRAPEFSNSSGSNISGDGGLIRNDGDFAKIEDGGCNCPRVAVILNSGKLIVCDGVIIGGSEYEKTVGKDEPVLKPCQNYDLQLMCICEGNTPLPVGRGVMALPPSTPGLDCSHPVFVLQLDSTAMVCPRGCFVLYVMTLFDGPADETVWSAKMMSILQFIREVVSPADFRHIYHHTKIVGFPSLASDSCCFTAAGFSFLSNVTETNNLVMDAAVNFSKTVCENLFPSMGFFNAKHPTVAESSSPMADNDSDSLFLDA